ncbi:MAG: hypothetical protein ACK5PT_03975, partial [Cereibacter sp.]
MQGAPSRGCRRCRTRQWRRHHARPVCDGLVPGADVVVAAGAVAPKTVGEGAALAGNSVRSLD